MRGLVCIVMFATGLVACDRTPTNAPSDAVNDGTAPTQPKPTTPGASDTGLAELTLAADDATNTASPAAILQPDDPSRLLFLSLEAPTSPLWQWQPPRSSAWLAQWIVPGPQGSEPAELVLWSSKRPAHDLTRESVPTWERQFRSGVIPTKASVEHRTIGGMDVHLIDLAGEYTGMGGGWHRPNFRQIVAIAAGPEGTVIIRLLGPKDTVEMHRSGFERMIEGLRTTH